MSSSLDDLEPYEFFQMELEESLKTYEKSKHLSSKEKIIINSFIEYVCFVRSISSFNQLDKQIIEIDFPDYLLSLFPEVYDSNEVIIIIRAYID